MSFLNDKLKTKKAGHSDGFRNLIDSTENERNISLSKSSRHFLRDLEIRGAMGQVPEHGIDEIIISPDNKAELFGTTTPVNANSIEGRVPDGFVELESLYCTGTQYCEIPNIIKTIDFHMIVKAASFKTTENLGTLFSIQNQNDTNTAFEVRVPDEKCDTNTYSCAFSMPKASHDASDSSGFFEVGITDDCKGWRAGQATLDSVTIDQMDEGVWSVTGSLGSQVYSGTYYTNNKEIYFFLSWDSENYFDGSFSYALIYNGKEKVSELVAAKRQSDGAIGILEIYGERRGNFYISSGTPFYSSYPGRPGFLEKEKTLYKLTLKSAKRGLPKGYREITELVSPGVPWTGGRNISHAYERYLKLPFVLSTDYIYDIDAYPTPRPYDGNYNAPMVYGGIYLSGVDRGGLDIPDTTIATFVDVGGSRYRAEQDSEFLRYRNLAKAYIGRAPEDPYTPSGLNLAKRFVLSFDENNDKHTFLSVYCDAVKNNVEYKGKFSISLFTDYSPEAQDIYFGIKRSAAIQCVTGFRLKKISVSDRSGELLFDVRACKKEDTGEFGVYYVNYEEGKEGFIPFTLVNEVDIEAIKEAGAPYWERLIGLTAFPEESQTYLSGESTLLRDIKEITIYLPEPLISIDGTYSEISLKKNEMTALTDRKVTNGNILGGAGYFNEFNIWVAKFEHFNLRSSPFINIVSDSFENIRGSLDDRYQEILNFTGPWQITAQSYAYINNVINRNARIWFTLPKEYDSVESVKEYLKSHPITFYVASNSDHDKIPIDLSKVEIGDGERELFIENEFGALSDDGISGYGTMLSNFILGDRKNPSYTKVQYYSNKSK